MYLSELCEDLELLREIIETALGNFHEKYGDIPKISARLDRDSPDEGIVMAEVVLEVSPESF